MFKLYYKWRYQRSQRAGAYKLPRQSHASSFFRIDLGSYLSQPAVRGRDFSRFDLPKKSRRWLGFVSILLVVLTLSWLIYESIEALSSFRN
jgi:hypothetical protein